MRIKLPLESPGGGELCWRDHCLSESIPSHVILAMGYLLGYNCCTSSAWFMYFSKWHRNMHFKRLKKAWRKDTYWWFALQSKVCSPCHGSGQRSWRDRLFLGSGQLLQRKSSWWQAVSGHAGQGDWQGSLPLDSQTLGSVVESTWWWSWHQKPPQTADLWVKELHLKAERQNSVRGSP